jgi:hypothetical protein
MDIVGFVLPAQRKFALAVFSPGEERPFGCRQFRIIVTTREQVAVGVGGHSDRGMPEPHKLFLTDLPWTCPYGFWGRYRFQKCPFYRHNLRVGASRP